MAEYQGWPDTPPEKYGYDFHKNGEITFEGKGEFSTELYTRFLCFIFPSCYSCFNCRKAVEVIENHDKSEPLFLYVAYQAPHGPIMKPPEKYLQMYKDINHFQNPGDPGPLYRAATITVMTDDYKFHFYCDHRRTLYGNVQAK